MKTILRHPLRGVAAAIAVPVLLLLLCVFALPAQYQETYLGAMADKQRRLEETAGKRIVVIGGSSVPFALRSDLLHAELPDYDVVDLGLYADMGLVCMLDWASAAIHPGDLIILAPEQSSAALSVRVGGEDVLQAADGAWWLLSRLSPARYEAIAAAMPAFAGKKLRYAFTGAPTSTDVYQHSSFNAYGDIDYADRVRNIMPGGFQANDLIRFNPAMLPEELVAEIRSFADRASRLGATVLWHFPPMNSAALAPGTPAAAVDAFYDHVLTATGLQILGDPHRCLLPPEWFYDTNYHLNASGAILFTRLLAEDLKVCLKDASPIAIAIPDMPALTGAAIHGDDACEDLFTYRAADDGWVLSGLTDEGRSAAALILPTWHEGLPVVAMDETLFAGGIAARSVTIQPNLSVLPDGLFDGCASLAQLVLTGEAPSAYAPGDDLMRGAQFLICVPSGAVDSYRRGYLWQKYSAYIQPAT